MNLEKATKDAAFWILSIVAFSSVAFVFGIIIVLFMEGLPALFQISFFDFFFGRRWYPVSSPPQFGLLPLLTGSLFVTLGGLAFAVPLGFLAAVFLAEICPRRVREILKPIVEILAGIPSVVYGFFGVVLLAPLVQRIFQLPTGLTALTASFLLGIMAVPVIVSVMEDALTAVPRDYREAAFALGATRWETIREVVVPAASSGLGAAVILGAGRIIGETMTVLMVAGGAALIPRSFLQPVRTMTATIAAEMAETPFGSLHYRVLFLVAVVLFLITLLLDLAVASFSRREVWKR
ncbi:MAG: phosphate ABC transporter permease subunit PstC [Candidatus Caldatribacterium sp.]|nr:phosphate ABC transporter permease subunit PstC [Candidatus Caldatribacterium sp.]